MILGVSCDEGWHCERHLAVDRLWPQQRLYMVWHSLWTPGAIIRGLWWLCYMHKQAPCCLMREMESFTIYTDTGVVKSCSWLVLLMRGIGCNDCGCYTTRLCRGGLQLKM